MIDWESYRKLFPHLREHVYLNHAAISPMNTRTLEAVEEFFKNRLEKNIEFWPEAMDRKARLITLIGKLINAPQNQIALVPNTSAGLNILAMGLDWKPGDRILLNDFEFPSNVIPFINLRRKGVEIDFVKNRDGAVFIEDIEKSLKPATRLLSISFVEFLNGYRNDLKRIGELCRQRNIIFCVDAIQGLGGLRLDVQETGIDFMATGGHKWLMWPAGIGFVYIAAHIFDRIYPAQAGWLSVQTPWDFFNYGQPFAENAQRFEPGTANTYGIIAAAAMLEIMLEIGPENIETKVLGNTDYLVRKLTESGYRLFTHSEPEVRSGIVSVYHDRAEELFNFLKENKVTVSLREGKIRISPHFYNDQSDFDKLLDYLHDFDNHS
ncbi:MAG: aminotransferase class V-fold PLP-dependent enzyme [Calditrichia bacterium]